VGDEFSATGGSGKTWRFRVTAVASGEPAVGEVKLLKDASYASFTGTINLPETAKWNYTNLTYVVTSSENHLFEGPGVTSVSINGINSVLLPSTCLHQDHLGSNLTSLSISYSGSPIPDYAFKGCTSLTTLAPSPPPALSSPAKPSPVAPPPVTTCLLL
jgi:hypothetical protein